MLDVTTGSTGSTVWQYIIYLCRRFYNRSYMFDVFTSSPYILRHLVGKKVSESVGVLQVPL